MPSFVTKGRTYEVDDDGFLRKPKQWNEEVARDFASLEGVRGLSEGHWKVIHYVRDYYLDFGIPPMVRRLCKETGYTIGEIYQLFPSGPAKGACKLAGLPKPTGLVFF